MSRRPHAATLVAGLSPRQRIWAALRARARVNADGYVTVEAISRETQAEPRICLDYMTGLTAAGYLHRIEGGRAKPGRYRLTRDTGVEAPRVRRDGSPVTQGLSQEQMWRTLRLLKVATNARELAAHASTAAVPVNERAANAYLQVLNTAGYLDLVAPGKGIGAGGILARYRLKARPHGHAPGPQPPMVCRTKVVFDPNLGAVVWAPTLTEADAVHD